MQQGTVQLTKSFSHLPILSEGMDKMADDFIERLRGMNEYLLLIHPDDEVYNKVIAEKQSFYDQYCQKISVKTKLPITVANFMATEEMEETLIRWIQRVSSQQKSFPVTLNGYREFHPHIIYLRVEDRLPFKQLATQLKVINSYIIPNGCRAVQFLTSSLLIIAPQLIDNVYEKQPLFIHKKHFAHRLLHMN